MKIIVIVCAIIKDLILKEERIILSLENNFGSYFYAGRVYQYYIDNAEDLSKGRIFELGFIVPKTEGIDIKTVVKVVRSVLGNEVTIQCKSLPRRSGWRLVMSLAQ